MQRLSSFYKHRPGLLLFGLLLSCAVDFSSVITLSLLIALAEMSSVLRKLNSLLLMFDGALSDTGMGVKSYLDQSLLIAGKY